MTTIRTVASLSRFQQLRRLVAGFILLLGPLAVLGGGVSSGHLSDYIRPFVGTQGEGNTYPGPSAPFGMVQLGPDTDRDLWETASGYEYSDTSIMGFSLTHLTGTGIPDLGDFLFMPQVGAPKLVAGTKADPDAGYRGRYSHEQEEASAGYYKVKLLNNDVTVELTAGERAGMMRFTFPQSDEAWIMTDMQHFLSGKRFHLIWSHLRVEDRSTITGFHLINGWARERYLYFAARYSKPFDRYRIMNNGVEAKYDSYRTYRFRSRNEAAGTNLQFLAGYNTSPGEPILVKVAVSAVSAANALQNLDSEIPPGDWNFQRMVDATRRQWDQELSKIQIEGSEEEKETFYTGMYHAFLAPNLYEDVTGEYRGVDSNIHHAKGFKNYTVFSLWDTYRATHPLFALIQAPRDADMINSLLAHYDQSVDHLLPIWSLQGNETWCMIGYHSVPVIVDAYLKGVKGFDPNRAYDAIKTTALNPDYDAVSAYARLGWVPCDEENESLSKTLEYAFDDFCVAQMAEVLGKTDDYHQFMKRACCYTNLYDPGIGLMRPKDSHGQWRAPFDPHFYNENTMSNDVTEGTSWQFSWYVPQDVPGLIRLFGGKERFAQKLDELFTFHEADKSKGVEDIQGRIGEYWHGNEPSHHIIYLYCYAGQPWKAAQRLHQVIDTQYGNKPNSLSGNDDCGQMSAWYLFTALGFYPVCPASDYYAIGSPAVPKAVIRLSNGKKFTMMAEDLSRENIYIQSVRLNGKNWETPFLPYRELKRGGTLIFKMGPQPSDWGTKGAPEKPF
ncbi:MAG TPA: GH92 family glycosyl hydrolase [Verrucomicrobiae bacterium]|nr:GH92 family glycosyl hydrolase [Verrucomicrobiae bacterium]